MKIINVRSGLGNQIFQYAFYLGVASKFDKEEVKLDVGSFEGNHSHNGYELENIFNIEGDYCSSYERRNISCELGSLTKRIKRKLVLFLRIKKEILEPFDKEFHFNEKLYGKADGDAFYRGFWQSYKYVDQVSSKLNNKLKFSPFIDEKNLNLEAYLTSGKKTFVSLHIRRGDYLEHPFFKGTCNLDYYRKAIAYLSNRIENMAVIVFSNDINWCQDNIDFTVDRYVDWNTGQNSYRDMQLMTLCEHNIIANSSFSWWGAWLNKNPQKIVIAPNKWMNDRCTPDLLPKEWVKL
jgi:hypothetical protein